MIKKVKHLDKKVMMNQKSRWERAEEVMNAYSLGFITDDECEEMMSLYLNELSVVKEVEYLEHL
jgi:hypothetical protein|tara:strand:+ start:762 stop:953 length:192 start_codon:yes stop_codon:yes gene_type:complete